MTELKLTDIHGGGRAISNIEVERFSGKLTGEVLRSVDPGYDEARTVWNAMVDWARAPNRSGNPSVFMGSSGSRSKRSVL